MCEDIDINLAEAVCKLAVASLFFLWIIQFLNSDKNGR